MNFFQPRRFDWGILKFDEHSLSLGQIDLCLDYARPNDLNHTSKSFDEFLVDSRSQIQNHTNTKYIKLQDFPNGKMLKVNRRNNSRHYRVYQREFGLVEILTLLSKPSDKQQNRGKEDLIYHYNSRVLGRQRLTFSKLWH